MIRYEPVLNEEALHALLSARKNERARLLGFIEELASNPAREGDFVECSAQGRAINVYLCDRWLVSTWVDHAVAELRIINIEFVP